MDKFSESNKRRKALNNNENENGHEIRGIM